MMKKKKGLRTAGGHIVVGASVGSMQRGERERERERSTDYSCFSALAYRCGGRSRAGTAARHVAERLRSTNRMPPDSLITCRMSGPCNS